MSYVKEKIKKIVADTAVPKLDSNDITSITTFVDMGFDSLQFIKLIVEIEENLGISIEDEMLDPKIFENYGYFEDIIINITLASEEV